MVWKEKGASVSPSRQLDRPVGSKVIPPTIITWRGKAGTREGRGKLFGPVFRGGGRIAGTRPAACPVCVFVSDYSKTNWSIVPQWKFCFSFRELEGKMESKGRGGEKCRSVGRCSRKWKLGQVVRKRMRRRVFFVVRMTRSDPQPSWSRRRAHNTQQTLTQQHNRRPIDYGGLPETDPTHFSQEGRPSTVWLISWEFSFRGEKRAAHRQHLTTNTIHVRSLCSRRPSLHTAEGFFSPRDVKDTGCF